MKCSIMAFFAAYVVNAAAIAQTTGSGTATMAITTPTVAVSTATSAVPDAHGYTPLNKEQVAELISGKKIVVKTPSGSTHMHFYKDGNVQVFGGGNSDRGTWHLNQLNNGNTQICRKYNTWPSGCHSIRKQGEQYFMGSGNPPFPIMEIAPL